MSGSNGNGYDPIAVERKWQERWSARGTNTWTDEELRTAERPFYNLMMFPYPSAEGLHVGNIYAFTGADIYGRFRRLRGDDVFEPIGFDAFGIHSENYALKVGTHPMELIPANVRNFTRQLKRIGAMYDWNHTVDTTQPDYYRWTQWLFLQLYKGGLAEKREAPVNWCPGCQTVLANEQVIAGECERCGTPVEQRYLEQWFFKITDYAQRLLDNLQWIDWSESTKRSQENWIGRSDGAQISFPVDWTPPPEFWREYLGEAEAEEIAREREASRARQEREIAESLRSRRQDDGGAPPASTGEPLEFESLPTESWIEEISIDVFTTRPDTVFGATFMVLAPEHPLVPWITTDEQRDVVETYRKKVASMDLVSRKKTDKEKTGVFTGAYCINPATGERIPIWIADYVLMEYGTGAIMAVPGHDQRDFEFAEKFALPIRRVVAGEGDHEGTPLHEAYLGEGVLVNSDQFSGMPWQEGKRAITDWLAERGVGEHRVNYRLHDWCISRQRYWGPPIPMLYCDRCGTVPVPEEDLPVELPHVENYKPDASGVSPLARDEEWFRVACPDCGGAARRETDVSDTFLDSAWYFLRYPSANRDDVAFDPELTRTWLPVHMYIGGEEHAVLHLLYSRFITMALQDLGLIDFEEPFRTFRKHGLIIREGAKMSKSRGNVVIPDEFIERFGADTFRTYLMFLGPYQEGGDFRELGIQGPYGFLHRLWDTVVRAADGDGESVSGEIERKLHATIRKVTEDVAALRYNTAIAAMMEYLNLVREGGRRASRAEVEPLVPLIAPFAPHLAEELWERLGHEDSIFDVTDAGDARRGNWPDYDPEKARADEIEFVVQVNGKVRARVAADRGLDQERAVEVAMTDDNVRRFVDGKDIRKVIFVPDRLVNLVVG